MWNEYMEWDNPIPMPVRTDLSRFTKKIRDLVIQAKSTGDKYHLPVKPLIGYFIRNRDMYFFSGSTGLGCRSNVGVNRL